MLESMYVKKYFIQKEIYMIQEQIKNIGSHRFIFFERHASYHQ